MVATAPDATVTAVPFPGSLRKLTFCLAPGDYTLMAIDTQDDGWWGGAKYWVSVEGTVVVDEEMGIRSSSLQRASFTVTLPQTARTAFQGNEAPQGGGGACFWEDAPPTNMESYRNESRNTALYGNFSATPARVLPASRDTTSYNAVSGESMVADPITFDLKDR